ncbi:MAG: D-tyrosyl-tRNA(Tyr) deacylase [Pseudobacteriovorax sp.]|nr:D-tyrosyl-tRNA(Tyr) deacylase [Pseudobacteriovorax sp.]
MRAVVQRVSEAAVSVEQVEIGRISQGLLVYLGVCQGDSSEDLMYVADKVANLRIFPDKDGKMNLSVKDIAGQVLVISQFTLYGDARKGRRPSFNQAERPEKAATIYQDFVDVLKSSFALHVEVGQFQASMRVSSVNDGPVTLIVDSSKII